MRKPGGKSRTARRRKSPTAKRDHTGIKGSLEHCESYDTTEALLGLAGIGTSTLPSCIKMFYSTQILARKGPLGTVWIAAHLERRLKRHQVFETSITVSVGETPLGRDLVYYSWASL